MSELHVAYWASSDSPSGPRAGVLSRPGQNSGDDLLDMREADVMIKAFATSEEASIWLREMDVDS